MNERSSLTEVRVDRWLWAARFFRTRSLAARAVDGGKVQVNGTRVKRSRNVAQGDELRIRKPPFEYIVTVRRLSERRGAAPDARLLYDETPESIHARESLRSQLRHQPNAIYEGKGRPTKRDRRRIDRLKGRR
jgi:ribosome-associated heat shock protein Hsp15